MRYAVNEKGIEQLNKLSSTLKNQVDEMKQSVSTMNSRIAGNVQGAGPHFEEIQEMVSEVATAANAIEEPVEEITETLMDLAEEYQAIIDKKLAQAGGTAAAASAGIAAGAGGGSPSGAAGMVSGTAGSATENSSGTGSSASGVSFGVGGSWNQIVHGLYGELPEGYSYGEGNPQMKPAIRSSEGRTAAVIVDALKGSGKVLFPGEAGKMAGGVRAYTGTEYGLIRSAFQNDNAPAHAKEKLAAVDSYIHAAPKYNGTVMRGVHVSEDVARTWLTGQPFNMRGPSSWSTDPYVAVKFAMDPGFGSKPDPIKAVFVLTDNKSGASVTHLSTYEGSESEVLAPSDTTYVCDGYTITGGGGVVIYVHEV